MMHKYYFDFEKLNSALDDPGKVMRVHNATLAMLPAAQHGGAILAVHDLESALIHLLAMFYQEIESQLEPHKWPGATDVTPIIGYIGSPNFRSLSDVANYEIGLIHLHEGQARFLEMQLCAAHDRRQNSIAYFKNSGYLSAVYMRAFRKFIEWTGLQEPASPLDWRVHLFCVACDYAMCPIAGYFGSPGEPTRLLDRFHPGARFRRACEVIASKQIANRLVRQFPSEFAVNHRFMIFAYEEIESTLNVAGEATFPEASRAILNFANTVLADQQPKQSLLGSSSRSQVSYPTMFPLFNLLRRHFTILFTRLRRPEFYYNPLTVALDDPGTLALLLPPTVSTKDGFQFMDVSPVEWKRKRGDEGLELMIGFYIGQVYSDLVRQLISVGGPFRFDFGWLPPEWAETVVEGAKKVFGSYFGTGVDDIVLQ